MVEFFRLKYKHNLVAIYLNFALDFSFVCNLHQFTTPIIMSALDNGFIQIQCTYHEQCAHVLTHSFPW